MEVLAVVQSHVVDCAGAELLATRSELEAERRKKVTLEFQLASERKQLELAQQACTTANERWEEAMTNSEVLRDQGIKDKEEADGRITELKKALAEERAKLASERAAYLDLCMAAVE
ncbi:hypothetical protein CsSME_00053846 [Camellia sinensis var. sinensis]